MPLDNARIDPPQSVALDQIPTHKAEDQSPFAVLPQVSYDDPAYDNGPTHVIQDEKLKQQQVISAPGHRGAVEEAISGPWQVGRKDWEVEDEDVDDAMAQSVDRQDGYENGGILMTPVLF